MDVLLQGVRLLKRPLLSFIALKRDHSVKPFAAPSQVNAEKLRLNLWRTTHLASPAFEPRLSCGPTGHALEMTDRSPFPGQN